MATASVGSNAPANSWIAIVQVFNGEGRGTPERARVLSRAYTAVKHGNERDFEATIFQWHTGISKRSRAFGIARACQLSIDARRAAAGRTVRVSQGGDDVTRSGD